MQKGKLLAQEQKLGSLNISPGCQKSLAALLASENIKFQCYFTVAVCQYVLNQTLGDKLKTKLNI